MLPVPMTLPGCARVAGSLSELLDGELGPADAERVLLHLEICPQCARLARDLAATIAALHRLRQRAPAGPASAR